MKNDKRSVITDNQMQLDNYIIYKAYFTSEHIREVTRIRQKKSRLKRVYYYMYLR